MPHRRDVAIHQLGTVLNVVPLTTTKDYVVLFEDPPERIDISAAPEDIGTAVLAAIQRCRLAVDEPSKHPDLMAKNLGVKNWNELQRKTTSYCSVMEIETAPHHLLINVCVKVRGGMEFTDEKYIVDPTNTKEIGQRVKQALAEYRRK